MPQQVRVLFNVGDTVLINELSPSTRFQVTSSSFDARSSSATYHLKSKSATKRIIVIVAEEKIALASSALAVNTGADEPLVCSQESRDTCALAQIVNVEDKSALASGGSGVNSGADEPSLRSQESRDSRGIGQMINVKDVERGDTIETTLDGRMGFNRALYVSKEPDWGPCFEYVDADSIHRYCFNQRVRLLAKSTSATRRSCISFEQPPPVYRDEHPHHDELRFEMLGLLHGGRSSGRLSGPLTRKLQALGISPESSRNLRKLRGAIAINPQYKNAKQDLPNSTPEDLDRSNKIDIGDLVEVTTKLGRPRKGMIARKILLSGPKPGRANPLGRGPRGPGFRIVDEIIGNVQDWTEERVKLIRKGTSWDKDYMLTRFPPCENVDFDIEAFEAQVAATDAKEAANERAYMMKKNAAMSENDEIEYDTPLKKVNVDTEQDEAQVQSSRGTSFDETTPVFASGTTEASQGGFCIGD
jgi:hypothetical protein